MVDVSPEIKHHCPALPAVTESLGCVLVGLKIQQDFKSLTASCFF